MEQIRLNKFISDSGVCSRREADIYIEQGHVFVNGKRAGLGLMVTNKERVLLNGMLVEPRDADEYIILALNKPRGVESTTEGTVENNIVSYVGYPDRIFPIGRLDKDSQGLIFLTNNGDIVNKILRAGNAHEKEYIVQVDKPITDEFIERMGNGVPILGQITKKCEVEKINSNTFRIVLIQGLNRQIRRMSEYLGYNVVKLERIRIMDINLQGIALGDWRYLTKEELRKLNKAVSQSSSEMGGAQQEYQPEKVTRKKAKESDTVGTSKRSTYSEILKGESRRKSSKKEIVFHNPKSKSLRKKGKAKAGKPRRRNRR